MLRFHYVATGRQAWWAIDNVTVSGAPIPAFAWTSIPAGFTSSVQNPGAETPTVNPTTYLVTATNALLGSCATSRVSVSILPLPSVAATNNSPFCSGTQDLNLSSNAPTATSFAWTGPGGYNSSASNPVIGSATTSASGNYQLLVTDANGCKDSVITPVTIYALPSVGITVIGSTNLCTGQTSADLQAAGASTYSWNTVPPDNNSLITIGYQVGMYPVGTYTVTGTDANGCINTQTQVITESAAPAAPLVSPAGTSTICFGPGGVIPFTFSCTNYTTDLMWSTSETTTSIAVDYEDVFNVTYTDANGCFATSASVLTVVDAVAPVINCPADTVICSTTPVLNSPSTSDNCSVASVSNDVPAVFPVGVQM